ncbi:mechanosensitive ion channel family protein [Sphingomonas sp. SM33]|uniref:Mechanosensitive ion channel family protein n=1 Tax=Sphingomonas telluris TaxID=2907998 RepID=A0ABS9VKY0_9SPHN|nr:mechanosensitive ion channel domain-containing protein [Sphingomonas telluris]MCH8615631.1 mechanosensitive ion channel family protein [Sphingomonas telluris]
MNGLNPIRPTQSVLSWLIANREGVLVGALVAAAIVALMLVARWIGHRMVAGETAGQHLGWRSVLGRVLAKTTIFFMVMAALDIVATYAQPPARFQHLVDIGFIIAFALQGAIWLRELILALIARRVGDGTTESALGNATAIIRVLVSITLFALAIVVILDNLGVNVTALVAGLGIGGIAIGLAAQGIFADLFAALSILFDKPFRKGDVVRYGTTTGTVERIGLKTTRLRGNGGEQVIMANTKLLEQELHNVTDARMRRSWLTFGLVYQTSPDTIARLPEIVTEAVESVKNCKLVRCCATGFGASSVDCELVYDDRTRDLDTIARHKSEIVVGVKRAFEREGIAFAYPTQTSFTAAPDGTFVMPYMRTDQSEAKPQA